MVHYPAFNNPEEYLQRRRGAFLSGMLKRAAERYALYRCFRDIGNISLMIDAPCGPGRLFHYWQKRCDTVLGVDLSDNMLQAANAELKKLALSGQVIKGDAFNLSSYVRQGADLVASIRFCYYFPRPTRVVLLQALAAASNQYVLVQYKTIKTIKGIINSARRRPPNHKSKHFCTHEEIAAEVEEAGLVCRRIVPIGAFSDRVFVLCEKTEISA
ncbi:MAG: class I SAM-dependent methyltransferase [bacterium]